MRTWQAVAVILLCLAAQARAQEEARERPAVRFEAVDVYVDSGTQALAAYQFELTAKDGKAAIVGVEGGEHPAFKEAPYYDPAALQRDRIIIGAFNTGRDLPTGRTRVARVHLQVSGGEKPVYTVTLNVAASSEGARIPATATVEQGGKR